MTYNHEPFDEPVCSPQTAERTAMHLAGFLVVIPCGYLTDNEAPSNFDSTQELSRPITRDRLCMPIASTSQRGEGQIQN